MFNQKPRSWVWEHFVDKPDNKASCKFCQKLILRSRGSTKGMIKHLKIHNIQDLTQNIDECSDSTQQPAKKRKLEQPNISGFLLKPSLDEAFTKCVAIDGYTPSSMVKSEAIIGYTKSLNYSNFF